MSFDDVARLLIVLAIADWLSVVVLIAEARAEHVLREGAIEYRIGANAFLSFVASLIAAIGLNRLFPFLPQDVVIGVIVFTCVAVSVPVIAWPIVRWLGGFR